MSTSDRVLDGLLEGLITLFAWRRKLRETTKRFWEAVDATDTRGR